MSLRFVSNLPPGNQKDKHPCIQASKPRVPEVGGRGGSLFNIYMATYFLLLCTIWAHPAKETQGADWAVLAKVRFSSAPSVKGLRTQPDSINLCLDKAGP
jgi:hypothetical protein